MHELALMADLMKKIQQIAQDEGAERVKAIKVTLGALSHTTPEHFREHFDQAAAGTVAEGAAVETVCENDTTAAHAQDIRLESVELEYPE